MQTGYRRAGFALTQGENHLTDVNETQYNQLNDDPKLVVNVEEQVGEIGSDELPKTKNTADKKAPAKDAPAKKAPAKKAPAKDAAAK